MIEDAELAEMHETLVAKLKVWRANNPRYGDRPPWPGDAPCYYCDVRDRCHWCIHNPGSHLYDLVRK